MSRNPIRMENDRLLICGLKMQDLEALKALRCDRKVYRYEPVFLPERQGTPEETLKAIRGMDLSETRQCILGVYEKTDPAELVGLAEYYDYKRSGKVISIGYRFLSKYWGRGIATNLVRLGTRYLKDSGMRRAFLGYTYTDIVRMYERAGYRICQRYFMAAKDL